MSVSYIDDRLDEEQAIGQPSGSVLYFSDGILEDQFSDSDSEETDSNIHRHLDESDMSLMQLIEYNARNFGGRLLSIMDYMGGGIASFLGVSTPKYISEYEYNKEQRASESYKEQRTIESYREQRTNETYKEQRTIESYREQRADES